MYMFNKFFIKKIRFHSDNNVFTEIYSLNREVLSEKGKILKVEVLNSIMNEIKITREIKDLNEIDVKLYLSDEETSNLDKIIENGNYLIDYVNLKLKKLH